MPGKACQLLSFIFFAALLSLGCSLTSVINRYKFHMAINDQHLSFLTLFMTGGAVTLIINRFLKVKDCWLEANNLITKDSHWHLYF